MNNVSSLRPHVNSEYFGNSDMDEKSNLMPKNETKTTMVRKTMAPTSSAQNLRSSLNSRGQAKTPSL